MHCSNCGADNPETARFCIACASAFPRRCPSCGTDNPPHAKFCAQCATRLSEHASPASPTALSDSPRRNVEVKASLTGGKTDGQLDGERKTVTALFADIKGSMDLMEDRDPEEARAIFDPALNLMIDSVHRYGGYIVQSTGDGIFALFGAPLADEDHPQRGLYAALRLQERLGQYSDQLRSQGRLPLQARVGLNTGEVVVRSIDTGKGHTEYTPIGHATSLAARMQALAPIGSIAATDVTRKLCEGYFTFKSLGLTVVKGVTEPVNVYEVTGLGQLRTRLQRAAARGLTKFVGRQREMDALKHAAEQAQAGHGQIVAVMADPGVGKSRLFHEFKAIEGGAERASSAGRDARPTKWMALEAYSVSHGKASAYLPVLELLSEYFEISGDDDERKRRDRILGKVLGLDRNLEDALPYLYSLHNITDAADSLAQMDPQIRRRRTLEAIKRILLRESLNQPLIIIFEDLHWIDAETQALLNLLVDAISSARIFMLVNYRPEYHHEWGSRMHYTQLRLDTLGRESADEMLSALLGDEAELEPLKRLVANKTEGNPFFVEEMVQALFEQGVLTRNGRVKLSQSLADIKIPPTVQAVLASRIDRLPANEKELLQTLAVMGREFSQELTQRVAAIPEAELELMLGNLQSRGFVYEQPTFPVAEYSFKHALTQEVAYNSVLVERRRQLHQRVACAIEAVYGETINDHLEDLAHHYSRAGNTDKASEYLGRAGELALRRSAYAEAQNNLMAALALFKDLPDGVQRADRELRLQLALGTALSCTVGWDSPERRRTTERARELSQRLGDTNELLRSLWNLCQSNIAQAADGLAKAFELAEESLRLAESTHEPELLVAAHYNMGECLWRSGRLGEASAHLNRALGLYDARQHRFLASDYGIDLWVFCSCMLSWIELFLGRADQAATRAQATLTYARELGHAFSLTFAMFSAAWIEHYRGRWQIQQELAHSAVTLAAENEFAEISCFARGMEGHALIAQGQRGEGIAEMAEALCEYRRLGALSNLTNISVTLIDAYTKVGQTEEAQELLAEAVSNAQPWDEAELLRLKGKLCLAQPVPDPREAETCFRRSIEVSQQQEAKFFELRATICLARLLASEQRRNEARTMLVEIYNWFTEGFDTADLKDAKALLDELSNPAGENNRLV
jgi:predicted ATPase/class 3 adenylate cyclase